MTSTRDQASVSYENLLPRSVVCVECDTSQTLVCPSCAANEQCQFYYPTNCTECERAYCAPADTTTSASSSSKSSHSSTNVGAIVGGVVGGLVAIAVITYLVWRFCVKTKRRPIDQEPIEDEPNELTTVEKSFADRRDQRASTHTVQSIASTVLTRASNIIQIAYIPGVTNRAAPSSPTSAVPPVPPIPSAVSRTNSVSGADEQHFFVPGDLRDSTYSGLSGYTDRTSYATRTSYAPRSSVASTIYGKNAVIVSAQQTGMRAKPEMVSVKSGKSSSASTPPVPAVDFEKYNVPRPVSPAGSTFSVGSTFLNNASAATPVRAQIIRLGSGNVKKVDGSKPSEQAPTPLSEVTSARDSTTWTIIEDSPSPDQGPFSDPPEQPANQSSTSLGAVIEEEPAQLASPRASAVLKEGRGTSPFGDEHATQE